MCFNELVFDIDCQLLIHGGEESSRKCSQCSAAAARVLPVNRWTGVVVCASDSLVSGNGSGFNFN